MEKQFLHHINAHDLCSHRDKILLAVSGGIDSMVMLHLFQQAGFAVGVAHCNFQLRGADSAADEVLVKNTAESLQIPFYIKHFETSSYAAANSLSIQMAARELRYAWFNELLQHHNHTYIATAHHVNDSLETVLLNLVRGTGLEGLTGIPHKQGKVIRPLLFATRTAIEAYATLHHIGWREDGSNNSDYYARNRVRHQVIPLLRQLNPSLEEGIMHTLERLKGSWELTKDALHHFVSEAVRYDGPIMHIQKSKLNAIPYPSVVLWELIKDKGFNYIQCRDITQAHHQVGAMFCSGSYQLTIDRQALLITERYDSSSFCINILNNTSEAVSNDERIDTSKLQWHVVPRHEFVLMKDESQAQLDLQKVNFPLVWRSWHPGDYFIPLGMKQHKKISDYLVDEKVPLPIKNSITVLESQGEIVWVVGMRIADPFKVTEHTAQVLVVKAEARPSE